MKADLDIVIQAVVLGKKGLELSAQITLHFQDKSSNAFHGIFGLVAEDLFGKRQDGARRLPATDGSKDSDPGEKPTVRDDQPIGILRGLRPLGVMDLANDHK